MKKLATITTALLLTVIAACQETEFKVYSNGLIYSEHAMSRLSHVVDSLNLKYRTCNYNQVFYSNPQTIGHIITTGVGQHQSSKEGHGKSNAA